MKIKVIIILVFSIFTLIDSALALEKSEVASVNVCPGNGDESSHPYSCSDSKIELYSVDYDPTTLKKLPKAEDLLAIIDCNEFKESLGLPEALQPYVILNWTITGKYEFVQCGEGEIIIINRFSGVVYWKKQTIEL